MGVEFLTPLGGLVAVGAVVTLAAFAFAERRARRVGAALGLSRPPRRSWLPQAGSLAAIPILLGVAAAQPVLDSSHRLRAEGGVEAFFVLDISRSMLAAGSPVAQTRFERARSDALVVRRALPDVPVGIATLTNRLLPQLFPTTDGAVFAETLSGAVGVERPPPDQSQSKQVTTYTPLADLQRQNYFDASAHRRLAVVFTDGETNLLNDARLRRALLRPPVVKVLFVHVAEPRERVFAPSGLPETGYTADPASMQKLQALARSIDGRAFAESQLGDVERTAQAALGGGTLVPAGTERHSRPLAPYVVLVAFVPLALILRRRNF